MESVRDADKGYARRESRKQITIVDVVEASMWVFRVIDNERTPETITVLCGQVTMVPEGAYAVLD